MPHMESCCAYMHVSPVPMQYADWKPPVHLKYFVSIIRIARKKARTFWMVLLFCGKFHVGLTLYSECFIIIFRVFVKEGRTYEKTLVHVPPPQRKRHGQTLCCRLRNRRPRLYLQVRDRGRSEGQVPQICLQHPSRGRGRRH